MHDGHQIPKIGTMVHDRQPKNEGNDISVSTCHVKRSPLVMSSVVETSLQRFLHSLRSVGMTTSENKYIVPKMQEYRKSGKR